MSSWQWIGIGFSASSYAGLLFYCWWCRRTISSLRQEKIELLNTQDRLRSIVLMLKKQVKLKTVSNRDLAEMIRKNAHKFKETMN